jgi:putative FmdB family regulatory protein
LPVYEYRCGGGHHYEMTEGFHAPTEHDCPTCGKHSRRQLSLPAVIFKGSGFYSTDNRKSGGSRSASVTADGDSGGSSNGHSHDGDNGQPHGSEPKVEATAD